MINSERAIQVNIQIMRTFTQLRNMLSIHEDLKHKIEDMEEKYDEQFRIVFEAIQQLLEEDQKRRDDLTLLCVPPTRLAGPCRRVLTQMLEN